jgi:hypothetical protein
MGGGMDFGDFIKELEPLPSPEVLIHLDGGKRFGFPGRLGRRGFQRTSRSGRAKVTCPANRGGFFFICENEAA